MGHLNKMEAEGAEESQIQLYHLLLHKNLPLLLLHHLLHHRQILLHQYLLQIYHLLLRLHHQTRLPLLLLHHHLHLDLMMEQKASAIEMEMMRVKGLTQMLE